MMAGNTSVYSIIRSTGANLNEYYVATLMSETQEESSLVIDLVVSCFLLSGGSWF